jgi:phosphate transport system substrate-binding protein
VKIRRRHLLFAAAGLAGCSPAGGLAVQGAGATFPAPLYKRWFREVHRRDPKVRVSYQPVGSGAGIRQYTAGLIDFGASDAAMTDAELAAARESVGDTVLLPVTAGAVAVVFNLPGFGGELRLSRATLAALFLGDIARWDDPRVQADNPGHPPPPVGVTVVRRAESSGTTYAFTSHLAAASPTWKKEVGASKTVDKWKAGVGARGNPGVAALVAQTAGAVGYLEAGYAALAGLPVAHLQNQAGRFVGPTPEAGQAALAGAALPPDRRLFLPDPAGPAAYPVVTYTWLLCRARHPSPAVGAAVREVVRYGLTDGQRLAADLGYIPLPAAVAATVLSAADTLA